MSQGRSLTGTPGSFLPFGDDATWARYWMTFLVFSVFPAPDSPLRGGTKGNKKGQQCSEVSPAHSKQSHSQPGPRFLQEVL